MRAIVYHGRGDVRLEERPDPTAVHAHVVVAVTRCGLCGTDASEFTRGPVLLSDAPTVLGHEFSGIVVSGDGLPLGTRVVSGAGVSCGICRRCIEGRSNLCHEYSTLGLSRDGGLADYVLVPTSTLHVVPVGLPDDLAVLAQPLAVGLHAVARADPREDDVVVLVGAGAIGSFVLLGLLDRATGPVVVVDVAESSRATARALGATLTVSAEEVETVVRDLSDGRGADVVFEASGARGSLGRAAALARRGGLVQAVGLPSGPQELDVTSLVLREIDVRSSVAHVSDVDMPAALRLLDARRPPIPTTTVPLSEAVERGLVPLSQGRVGAKVLVTTDG